MSFPAPGPASCGLEMVPDCMRAIVVAITFFVTASVPPLQSEGMSELLWTALATASASLAAKPVDAFKATPKTTAARIIVGKIFLRKPTLKIMICPPRSAMQGRADITKLTHYPKVLVLFLTIAAFRAFDCGFQGTRNDRHARPSRPDPPLPPQGVVPLPPPLFQRRWRRRPG